MKKNLKEINNLKKKNRLYKYMFLKPTERGRRSGQ